MKIPFAALIFVLFASVLHADPLKCNLAGYKASPGVSATIAEDALALIWDGALQIPKAFFCLRQKWSFLLSPSKE